MRSWRAIHVGGDDLAARRDRHLDDDRETFLALVQRREIRRQPLRQHREDLRVGVHRRRVGARMTVDGAAGLHERIDVGDRHEDLHRAVRGRLGHRELIEIARVVVVDRRPQALAQIADPVPRRVAAGGDCL
jgi:hypothetical protein